MSAVRRWAPLFAVAVISSSLTAGVLIGTGSAGVRQSGRTLSDTTISLRAGQTVQIPQFKWRCSISTEPNAAGHQVPYVFGCYPSDWHQNCNDAPVVWMFKNAATVSGAMPPSRGSSSNGYIFYKKQLC